MARILMLCHDQNLDRRVVAQAVTLIEMGHEVELLALSMTGDTVEEQAPEGFALTRIGLNHIVPENIMYRRYIARQNQLNDLLNRGANRYPTRTALFQRLFGHGSRLNWHAYRVRLLAYYRNRSMHDPLPFRGAFVLHGSPRRSDIVQVHDLPALEAGAELAAAWGVPLVYDAHELYPEQRAFSRIQRDICSRMEASQIIKAQLVFAVNDSIADEMARRYGIARPLTLLNAIDRHPNFDPDASYDLLRAKLGLPAERRILLFQGGFSPHRNLENLIQAMTQIRRTDVDLVMMGFGAFGDLLKARAARLGLLGKRVHFLPAVPQSELLQHSASADIGIIPYPHVDLNSYFCTPNKLFEFIQAGLPILANDSPELNRFVRQNAFGRSAIMGTARDIAQAIDAAFADMALPDWRSNIRARRSEFAWRGQGDIYGAAMTRIIEAAGPRTRSVLSEEAS